MTDNTQSDVVEKAAEIGALIRFARSRCDADTPAVKALNNALDLLGRAALRSDRDAVVEWQPIETAPKGDGQYGPDILLWQAGVSGEQKIGMFHWFVDGFVADGWEHDPALNPTHWRSLPAPPADLKGDR